jgi:hypothetical protein
MITISFSGLFAQDPVQGITTLRLSHGVSVTIDRPAVLHTGRPYMIIFYALPNGNSTAWTMGKKLQPGDDWHYDIQHIRAQMAFVRTKLPKQNIVLVYLENELKAWPAWKKANPAFRQIIPGIIDSIAGLFPPKKRTIQLNGHSGGGSFIFGYLASVEKIPSAVRRISFLDSDYGYDSSYYPKLKTWLQTVKGSQLNVFAYNDSVALYNGKRVVSDTGGTWYRSHLLLRHLAADYRFSEKSTDSIQSFSSADDRIRFFFKPNYNQGIYHTQQVELNGFIHSILCGTRKESDGYSYYGPRAYSALIQ